jgi:hypothetical protein
VSKEPPVKVCCHGFCAYTHVTGKRCPRVSTATESKASVMSEDPTSPTAHGDQEARGLLAALGMTHRDAVIGIGSDEWIVYMLGPWKFPDLNTWEGWPVRYKRMGEMRAQ